MILINSIKQKRETTLKNDMTGFTLILSMRCLRSWWKNYYHFTKSLEAFWKATVVIKINKKLWVPEKNNHKEQYFNNELSWILLQRVKQKNIYIRISVFFITWKVNSIYPPNLCFLISIPLWFYIDHFATGIFFYQSESWMK